MDANNNHNSKVNDFPEAPARWNTRYIDPNGFECQITLRGDSGSELLEKVTNAITYLLKNGCTPYAYYRNGSRQVESKVEKSKKEEVKNDGKDNPAWCPIHQCEMKRWDKNGRVWYSHKVDGEWCSGK
jgi:ribonucleotide reductase alpha subunit